MDVKYTNLYPRQFPDLMGGSGMIRVLAEYVKESKSYRAFTEPVKGTLVKVQVAKGLYGPRYRFFVEISPDHRIVINTDPLGAKVLIWALTSPEVNPLEPVSFVPAPIEKKGNQCYLTVLSATGEPLVPTTRLPDSLVNKGLETLKEAGVRVWVD